MKWVFSTAVFVILGFSLFGCGGDSATNSGNSGTPTPFNVGVNSSAAGGENFLDVSSFPLDQIEEITSRDGIPALTDPPFVDPGHEGAAYLEDSDLVLGLRIGSAAKAYPHNIGWWHEIVNDIVGGSLVVTFCPLTGTGMVFRDGNGELGGRFTAGVSGLLFNNNLIMYDRRDGETLYPQMTFSGIKGSNLSESLVLMPVIETTWGYWKRLHPNTTVVSSLNGEYTPDMYVHYPYGDYRELDTVPFFSVFPRLDSNPMAERFEPKSRVLGVRFGSQAKAYPFENLENEAVINDNVAGQDIVVVYYGAEQLAIPYFRWMDQTLTFDRVASNDPVYPFMLKDRETGTVWNLMGEALEGQLEGRELAQVPAHNAFWFAWATFWRDTEIFQ